ncbi:uncharacterized protein BcabD6B2_48240 [Babesia caballi]|uniref:ATPTG10-like domain-containing protein n=1 Tax=Babesia caballi TaxID=5871 RepID=A0AAV4M037_BABCB|nr:hypothetical protein BcabD6B2_48240 [Babesia caballi]
MCAGAPHEGAPAQPRRLALAGLSPHYYLTKTHEHSAAMAPDASTGAGGPSLPVTHVERVAADINNLNRFAAASQVGDRKTMIECFNAFSWRDARVLSHVERYCAADHEERKLIDDVYRVLCPSFDRVQGPSFAAMSLWLKARLHLQHQTSPFSPVRH